GTALAGCTADHPPGRRSQVLPGLQAVAGLGGVPRMKTYLPFIIAGLTNGSIYGMAAVGLVLTYKTSGIFNFAHGAQAALAAYLMFEFRERMGLAWPLAGLLSLLLAGVVAGLVLERGAALLASASVALDARLLTLLVFFAFGAAAVGASSSLPLTYIGGIGIGVGAALVTKFVGEHQLQGPIQSLPVNLPFIVLFVALLVAPTRKL